MAGQPILDENGRPQFDIVKLEKPQVFSAYVFNAAQIEGIPPQGKKPFTWDPIKEAERILQLSKARITHDAPDYPFYRPSTDSIHLPDRGRLVIAEGYATAASIREQYDRAFTATPAADVQFIAAFDAGNVPAVAQAIREHTQNFQLS